jgi:hypothetical protein
MLDHDLVEQNDFRDKIQLSKGEMGEYKCNTRGFGGDAGRQIDLP